MSETSIQAPLTVRDLLDTPRLGRRRVAVILVGFLCVLLDGIDIGVWGFVYPHVIADWGVTVQQVTVVATAGYIALALGALVAGPVADRFGRKPTLLVSVALFAVSLLVAGSTSSFETIGICRAIACAGLGAVMPTAITLVSEYLPRKRKALLVTVVFCGFPLGQAVVGYMAAFIVPTLGWPSLLIVGGVAGLALLPLVALFLPESLTMLLNSSHRLSRAERIVGRLARSLQEERPIAITAEPQAAGTPPLEGGIRTVLSRKLVLTSVVVWFAYLVNCTVTYVLIGYLPLIMAQMGTGAEGSGQVIGMAGWGGLIGSLIIGYTMSRFNQYKVLIIGLALTAASISIVAFGQWPLSALLALGLVWGLLNGGSNGGMNAFASEAFPPHARATGVSWMHSAGKLGAILSGLFGGLMIAAGWGIGAIFVAFAVPLLIAAGGFGALALKQRVDAASYNEGLES
ncbi:MFS transporter [Paenarthrobacter sp. NyZ202]|uniref:MFS transporter n=1 Tax=Paenarthrobacter sp. NyZ202 TaxID=3402689 RepID=UPI003CECD18F